MNKVYIFLILTLLLLPFVYAEQTTLGVFKKGECIQLLQTCSNCTYVNFTSVYSPNSTLLIQDKQSTKQGTQYNYTFCNTTATGIYNVNGVGDIDGINTVFSYDFEVTYSGYYIDNYMKISIILICFLLIGVCTFFTFYIESGLKFVFLIGTFLLIPFTLNILFNLSLESGISTTIVDLLKMAYRLSVYIFYAIFLYVLVKLTVELKIRKNPMPTMGSPLQRTRWAREERQRGYSYKR